MSEHEKQLLFGKRFKKTLVQKPHCFNLFDKVLNLLARFKKMIELFNKAMFWFEII